MRAGYSHPRQPLQRRQPTPGSVKTAAACPHLPPQLQSEHSVATRAHILVAWPSDIQHSMQCVRGTQAIKHIQIYCSHHATAVQPGGSFRC